MTYRVVIVTGAAGFLGSAIAVDLSRDCQVVALDRRQPSAALLEAAPDIRWHRLDIADDDGLAAAFAETVSTLGRIDFLIHLAAFYHTGGDWRPEYDCTNVQGTANVLRRAMEHGIRRVIFASSIAAMQPRPDGGLLTERTPTAEHFPYAKSKSLGEQIVREASDRLAGTVLRIGGVFSDWSELVPLTSLIQQWGSKSPIRRLVVGRGLTGIPYVHRHDVVRIVRCCIEGHEDLGRYEVFLASQEGTVSHNQLFVALQHINDRGEGARPVYVSPTVAKIGLYLKLCLGYLARYRAYERPWMLEYVDQPWVVDTTHTRNTLGWRCTPGMEVLDRLPTIHAHFQQDRRIWEHRNRMRGFGVYSYPGATD